MQIADFCDTMSGFTDFESAADHRLAENFGLDSRLCISGSLDCSNQTEVRITFIGLRQYVGGIVTP